MTKLSDEILPGIDRGNWRQRTDAILGRPAALRQTTRRLIGRALARRPNFTRHCHKVTTS